MTREEAVLPLEEDVGSNRAVEVFIMNPFSPPYEEEPGYWSQDFLVGKAMWWWMEDEICSRCGAAVHSSDDLVLLGQNTGYIGVHRDCLDVMENHAIEQYLEGHE